MPTVTVIPVGDGSPVQYTNLPTGYNSLGRDRSIITAVCIRKDSNLSGIHRIGRQIIMIIIILQQYSQICQKKEASYPY